MTYQLKGKIDTTNKKKKKKELMAALPKEIDASELEYISSAGLRVLLKLHDLFAVYAFLRQREDDIFTVSTKSNLNN